MFYRLELKDHIRVPPDHFNVDVEKAVLECLALKYNNYIGEEVGVIIGVVKINQVGEGIIIPGDGASYYDTTFEVLTYKPELQEMVMGKVLDIADFGAFITIGPIEGMAHISQTMDDFVSFAKEKVLIGRDTKRTLKTGDICKSRLIAVSFKEPTNPKIGLTMRQPALGRLDWLAEDALKATEAGAEAKEKTPAKAEKEKKAKK
jgi:DNA-directed RNA polymerase subunit E'